MKSASRVFRFLPAVSLVLLLASCASSERMVRMSGGVIDSYSIPEKHRLRSEKFRKTEQNAGSRKALNEMEPGTDGTLVNLWPFFFRSRQYFSILWPLADFDPYGMAVRPFYNQEGDDKSILFPLSSWNTADGSGWCLLGIWNKDSFFFFPLVRHGFREENDWLYYTPFFIQTWKTRKKPYWNNPLKRESFTEFMLGYGFSRISADTSGYERIFSFFDPEKKDRAALENALRYLNFQLPEKNETTRQWSERIFASLPERESISAGFFPLFHWEKSPGNESLRLLLLFSGETGKNGGSWGATPFLGQFETMRRTLIPTYGISHDLYLAKRSFDAWLLLSRFERKDVPEDTARLRKYNDLYWKLSRHSQDIRSSAIQKQLQELGLTLPETVVDPGTLRLFLEDRLKEEAASMKTVPEYSGGFLPLFDYSFRNDRSFWCIPALISWYSRNDSRTFWGSIPLLTFSRTSSEKELFTVAGPLIYLTKTVRKVPGSESYANLPVYSRTTFWTEDADSQAEYENEYALLGLFYRGTDHFLVEKEGLPPGVTEKVRNEMDRLFREKRSLDERRIELKRREEKNNARKADSRLHELEKLLETERIRLAGEELAEKDVKFRLDLAKLKGTAGQVSFELPEGFLNDEASLREAKCRLLDQNTESRKHQDIGNGILWRREVFCNGDSKWNVCGVLAGGETKGDQEYSHILHLLYRHTRKGDRSETLCFPFLVWKEDGADRDFSFMWRVFHLKKTAGKTEGHILFIPF